MTALAHCTASLLPVNKYHYWALTAGSWNQCQSASATANPYKFKYGRDIHSGFAGEYKLHSMFGVLHQLLCDETTNKKESTGLLSYLLIPDTVTFFPGHPGQPAWYLSSKVEMGTIKRKNSQNVTPRNILDAFTRRKARRSVQQGRASGIVAMLISDVLPNPGIEQSDEFGESVVEYLDEVLLRDFLERRAPSFSGLLQKWVDPQGHHNSVIHAVWTSTLCQVTCRTNLRSMSDRRCSMYDRAVTFDGTETHTKRDLVSNQTRDHIIHVCSTMAKHIALVTDGRCNIRRMTAYFKIRHDGRVAFLWCSSLQLASPIDGLSTTSPLVSRPYSPAMIVPHDVDAQYATERSRPYVCPVSNRVCKASEAQTLISYKMIIMEWNARFAAADEASLAAFRPSSARYRPSSGRTTPRQAPATPPEHLHAAAQSQQESARPLSRPFSGRDRRDAPLPPTADGGQHSGQDAGGGRTADRVATPTLPAATAAAGGGGGGGGGGTAPPQQLTAETCIPELIRRLEKLQDPDLYRRLLHDPAFLYKQVRVADDVAAYFSAFAAAAAAAAAVAVPPASLEGIPAAVGGPGGAGGLGRFLDAVPVGRAGATPPLPRPLVRHPSGAGSTAHAHPPAGPSRISPRLSPRVEAAAAASAAAAAAAPSAGEHTHSGSQLLPPPLLPEAGSGRAPAPMLGRLELDASFFSSFTTGRDGPLLPPIPPPQGEAPHHPPAAAAPHVRTLEPSPASQQWSPNAAAAAAAAAALASAAGRASAGGHVGGGGGSSAAALGFDSDESPRRRTMARAAAAREQHLRRLHQAAAAAARRRQPPQFNVPAAAQPLGNDAAAAAAHPPSHPPSAPPASRVPAAFPGFPVRTQEGPWAALSALTPSLRARVPRLALAGLGRVGTAAAEDSIRASTDRASIAKVVVVGGAGAGLPVAAAAGLIIPGAARAPAGPPPAARTAPSSARSSAHGKRAFEEGAPGAAAAGEFSAGGVGVMGGAEWRAALEKSMEWHRGQADLERRRVAHMIAETRRALKMGGGGREADGASADAAEYAAAAPGVAARQQLPSAWGAGAGGEDDLSVAGPDSAKRHEAPGERREDLGRRGDGVQLLRGGGGEGLAEQGGSEESGAAADEDADGTAEEEEEWDEEYEEGDEEGDEDEDEEGDVDIVGGGGWEEPGGGGRQGESPPLEREPLAGASDDDRAAEAREAPSRRGGEADSVRWEEGTAPGRGDGGRDPGPPAGDQGGENSGGAFLDDLLGEMDELERGYFLSVIGDQ